MECVTCKCTTGEPCLFCDSCQRSTHRECTGLNASELKVMDLKGKRLLKFYCEDCQNGIKLIPKLLVKIDKLEGQINDLKKLNDNISDSTVSENEDIISEIIDRQSRASNIVIFNVNESKLNSSRERNSEDNKTVHTILKDLDINKDGIKQFRLGKAEPGKNRPIKIILNSPEDAKYVLKNKYNITVPNIRIYSDQTKAQLQYLRKVKADLQVLIEKGDVNKTIKFFKNKPTIVDKQKNSKVKNSN